MSLISQPQRSAPAFHEALGAYGPRLVWELNRTCRACLVAIVVMASVRTAIGFTIAADQVRAVGVYDALLPPPPVPILDMRDPAEIAALIGGIEFGQERDCVPLGSVPGAIAYVEFADGAVERYELLAAYTHLAKPGMRRACYALSDAASAQFRAMTRAVTLPSQTPTRTPTPRAAPCEWTAPLCNGACAPRSTCKATVGTCAAGPHTARSCDPQDPFRVACSGFPCVAEACACVGVSP